MDTMNFLGLQCVDEAYLKFIRRLPCPISGWSAGCDAHHVAVIGRKGQRNDHYAVPLSHQVHVGKGHIGREEFEQGTGGQDARDFCIALLGLYIRFLRGQYDPDFDIESGWVEYRRAVGIL